MKKYLYSIVFATLILMSTTAVKASNEVYYINENNIEMTETEYNNLLGLGFTENYIAKMSQDEFITNKDLEGTLLGESKNYYKITTAMRNGIKTTTKEEITKEEAEKMQSQNNPTKGPSGNYYDGVVATYVISVTSKIAGISNTYMRYMNITEWLTMPSDKYYDIIGIGIEPTKVKIGSAIVFREDWRKTDNTTGYNTTCYPKKESTGGSAIFELPTGSLQSLEATLYFNVRKQSGVGTITSLFATSDYAHAISNVNPNNLLNHYSVDYVNGIVIDSTYSAYYTSNTAAVASFVGTW